MYHRCLKTWTFSLALLTLAASIAAGQENNVVYLWPNGAPGFENKKDEKEKVVQASKTQRRVSNIHNPSLTVYLPAKDKATGAAIIIAPGGGHKFLSIDQEGYDIAKWLSDRGIASFVLKHRLQNDESSTEKLYSYKVHALQDAQRAVRLVRSNAKEWGVNPDKVGFMGFSAGGQVAGLLAFNFDNGKADAKDAVERQKSRPDFQVLIYPGGIGAPKAIPKETPPAFLAAADNDKTSETIANYYLTLRAAKIPAELHIYSTGGHGFGLTKANVAIASWQARLYDWMADEKFITKSSK